MTVCAFRWSPRHFDVLAVLPPDFLLDRLLVTYTVADVGFVLFKLVLFVVVASALGGRALAGSLGCLRRMLPLAASPSETKLIPSGRLRGERTRQEGKGHERCEKTRSC